LSRHRSIRYKRPHLDYGKKTGDGDPDAVRANPDVISAYLGASH